MLSKIKNNGFKVMMFWFLIMLIISGCSNKSNNSQISISPKKINGAVQLPQGSIVSPNQLTAISLVGSSPIKNDGSFSLNIVDKAKYQLIVVEGQSNNPVLLSYITTSTNPVINAQTTAVTLVALHPIFWGTYGEYYTQITNSIEAHPSFKALVSDITNIVTQSNYNILSYLNHDSPINILINKIALDVAGQVLAHMQPTQYTQNLLSKPNLVSFITLGTPPASNACQGAPFVASTSTGGNNIAIVNPTNVYYGTGIYTSSNSLMTLRLLSKVGGLINATWNSITGWLSGSCSYPSEGLSLGNGNYNVLISKEFTFDQSKKPEATEATIQNMVYFLTQLFSVAVDISLGGNNAVITAFVAKASGCLVNELTANSIQLVNLNTDMANGNYAGFLNDMLNLTKKIAPQSISCALTGSQTIDLSTIITTINSIAATLALGDSAGLAKAGTTILNKISPFVLDMVTKPTILTYNITLSNDILTDVTPKQIPPYVVLNATPTLTTPNGPVINLSAQTSDIDGTITTYNWSVNGGSIQSSNDTAVWDPPSSLGLYTINVEVIDNNGLSANASVSINVTSPITISCSYSINPTSQSFTSTGGSGSISVTAGSGCNWNATSNVSWITISSGSSGSGNGTVNYSVAANTGASCQYGTITVAGNTFIVTQAGTSNSCLANSVWPKFHNNMQNTGLSSIDTSADTGTLKWSYTTGSWIVSSPAIGADGTIYVGSADKKLYAINPNGTLKWSYATGNSIASDPAIGADGTIYVGSEDNNLYAINPNGGLKWSYTTGDWINSSPAIGADGTIYVSSEDNKLYAINPNGTLKWSYTTGSWIVSSPAIGADGTIYVGSEDNNLYAINPNGGLKWSYTTGGGIDSSPAIGADGTIYVSSKDYNLYAINPNGTLKWSYTASGLMVSSPAVGADGTIYVGFDVNLYAINPNGTLKWSYTEGSWIASSPAIGADGTIYVGSKDNKLHAIR